MNLYQLYFAEICRHRMNAIMDTWPQNTQIRIQDSIKERFQFIVKTHYNILLINFSHDRTKSYCIKTKTLNSCIPW